MKNLFKSLLGLLVMAAICASAQTPVYAPVTLAANIALLSSSATNLGTPSTSSAITGVILDCSGQAKVAVSIVTTNSKADAVNANILYYQRSVLGSSNTFETTLNPIGWTTTAADINPGAPRVIITNLDSLGCGYIKFPYLTNSSGANTNIGVFTLSYGVKRSAP